MRLNWRIFSVLTVVAAVGLAASAAWADPSPKKAKSFKAELLSGQSECDLGDASSNTPGLGIPACTPVDADPTCGFQAGAGTGKVQAKVSGADIKVKANLKKLDPSCDGLTLTAVATVQITTDGCTGAAARCTSINLSIPLGDCTVSNDSCKINTTVVTELGPVLAAGLNTEIDLIEVTVRNGGILGPKTFKTGVLVP